MKDNNSKRKSKLLRRILLLVIAALLLLYLFVPVFICKAPPFRVFQLDADEVTEIYICDGVKGWEITYTDDEDIAGLVETINQIHTKFWLFVPAFFHRGGWDYRAIIRTDQREFDFTFHENSLTYQDSYANTYSFLTTDGLAELMQRVDTDGTWIATY